MKKFSKINFTRLAGEDLTAERKAVAVQPQAQRHQRAVASFFFGTAKLGFGVTGALTFEVGVGQIVQDDTPV